MTVAYAGVEGLGRATSEVSAPERLVCGYLGWIPLLWFLGLKLPASFILVFCTLIFVRSRFAWSLAMPWFFVGVVQIVSVLINLYDSGQPWWMIGKHLLASYVSGWFILGAALAIGASGFLRSISLARAINHLSVWSLGLASAAYLLSAFLRQPSLYLLSPTAYFVPQSLPAREFSFGLFIFSWDELFGVALPRISLFYPWPTALGVAGVCTVFILWGDERLPRYKAGVAIGFFLAVASLGRLEILTLIVCLVFRGFLASTNRVQAAIATSAISIFLASCIFVGPPAQLFSDVNAFVTSGRPGASESREAVYEASWKGVHQAPIVGHGWPGPLLSWDDSLSVYGVQSGLAVGTHSAISGLLYIGGAITFTAFCLAFAFSVGVSIPYIRQSRNAQNSITIWLGLALTCIGEGFQSLVLPLLFVFFWLGNSAATLRRESGTV